MNLDVTISKFKQGGEFTNDNGEKVKYGHKVVVIYRGEVMELRSDIDLSDYVKTEVTLGVELRSGSKYQASLVVTNVSV